ncbi:hypothetical protein [Occallatibacter riparius]|uniref:Lipoprotein n=1 Tax=Occallatibacter riparius TaxID=1002689 RepID=A0A9J7BQ45_9BACT|nr:hypothetical protein [Occallatibacter riparius]UWZ84824.1 hypothetical protein MOP44_02540 [Occallatibacter riparius]
MFKPILALVMVCAGCSCSAQTLGEELSKAGIPASGFSSTDLTQPVNASSGRDQGSNYLVYMRVNRENILSGFPQLVRYDSGTRRLVRKELPVGEKENCCGSPNGITFTRSYQLLEFHLSPSASTVIVTDRSLKPVEILYGFGIREIAPDEVIFTEDMVHFAPAHPERIMLADLRTGASQELYPPKGDALRAAFAKEHKEHMPPHDVCIAMNDPCRPDYYDEAIEFLVANAPERFSIRVSRDAVHSMTKDADPDSVASDRAFYVYQRREGQWFYCSQPLSGTTDEGPNCLPSLPVVADGAPEFQRPLIRRVN